MAEHIRPGTRADDSVQYVRGFNGELVDVTSLNRPDLAWRYVDAQFHEHCWYESTQPALVYSVNRTYTLPTLVQIIDHEGDDDHPPEFHYECKACRKGHR